jgi:hypothetical protein
VRGVASKLLEKRINGVNELKTLVDRVVRGKDVYQRVEPCRYLTGPIMLEWIVKSDVVSILLVRTAAAATAGKRGALTRLPSQGPSSHAELIKRSPPVLKFLAANNVRWRLAMSGAHAR